MHFGLAFNSKDSGFKCGYTEPSLQQIRDALEIVSSGEKAPKKARTATTHKSIPRIDVPPSSTFPSPLILPGNELANDPDYPPQSVQDWLNDGPNKVTKQRRTIYLIPPPGMAKECSFVADWTRPGRNGNESTTGVHPPQVDDIAEYLRAFYHGMTVKLLKIPGWEFTAWEGDEDDDSPKMPATASAIPPYIGLCTGTEVVRIRCRREKKFAAQLNLNDLLDVALEILPTDAYAICMLVHHDLYEDEQDDFCCGRAYGGSRVAVVSSARYRPELDVFKKMGPSRVCDERDNAWPASHCISYLARVLNGVNHKPPGIPPSMIGCTSFLEYYPGSAIAAGVMAFQSLSPPTSSKELAALWFGRVCKTVSHEIGHCFGIDHCVFLSCMMQGTASVAEDVRQPPYLCPIDLAKVQRAIGTTDVIARYDALLKFCEKWNHDRMFAAFAAWLYIRIEQQRTFVS